MIITDDSKTTSMMITLYLYVGPCFGNKKRKDRRSPENRVMMLHDWTQWMFRLERAWKAQLLNLWWTITFKGSWFMVSEEKWKTFFFFRLDKMYRERYWFCVRKNLLHCNSGISSQLWNLFSKMEPISYKAEKGEPSAHKL